MEIYQMIVSKQKSNLAYAKTCKGKASPIHTPNNPLFHSRKNSKQNIYDDLINDLQPDQNLYINELINKQTKKNKKQGKQPQKKELESTLLEKFNTCILNPGSQKSIKGHKRKDSMNKTPSSSTRKRIRQKQNSWMMTPPLEQKPQSPQPKSQMAQNTLEAKEKCSFIDSITGYLNHLGQYHKDHNAKDASKQPQYTQIQQSEESEQDTQQPSQSIDAEAFQFLLCQLQQNKYRNEYLEEKIYRKDHKIQEMGNIIKSLCGELEFLKKQFKRQSKKKHNYQSLFDGFKQKMQRVRSDSKHNYASLKQFQRHSYVPQSREIFEDLKHRKSEQPILHQFRNTYDYSQLSKFKEESSFLKKKGKKSNYGLRTAPEPDGSFISSEKQSYY